MINCNPSYLDLPTKDNKSSCEANLESERAENEQNINSSIKPTSKQNEINGDTGDDQDGRQRNVTDSSINDPPNSKPTRGKLYKI